MSWSSPLILIKWAQIPNFESLKNSPVYLSYSDVRVEVIWCLHLISSALMFGIKSINQNSSSRFLWEFLFLSSIYLKMKMV